MVTDPQPPRHHDCAFSGPGRLDCALALATSSARDHKPLPLAPGLEYGGKDLVSIDARGPGLSLSLLSCTAGPRDGLCALCLLFQH